jgi:hypothetical protein
MNGSAVFLFAALKTRLTLAARRCGVAAEAAVDVLLRAMGLPEDVREAARAVRRRRDGVGEAGRVLGWFEGVGASETSLSSRGSGDPPL